MKPKNVQVHIMENTLEHLSYATLNVQNYIIFRKVLFNTMLYKWTIKIVQDLQYLERFCVALKVWLDKKT